MLRILVFEFKPGQKVYNQDLLAPINSYEFLKKINLSFFVFCLCKYLIFFLIKTSKNLFLVHAEINLQPPLFLYIRKTEKVGMRVSIFFIFSSASFTEMRLGSFVFSCLIWRENVPLCIAHKTRYLKWFVIKLGAFLFKRNGFCKRCLVNE